MKGPGETITVLKYIFFNRSTEIQDLLGGVESLLCRSRLSTLSIENLTIYSTTRRLVNRLVLTPPEKRFAQGRNRGPRQ